MNQFLKTKKEIEEWLEINFIFHYRITDDLKVNVINGVNLSFQKLKFFPVQFGSVDGDFYCNNNNLTSLLGAPQHIDGEFNCADNSLTSLRFGPQNLRRGVSEGNYYCDHNQLISLCGAPPGVGGHFNCANNLLESLEHGPKQVHGFFNATNNLLKTIEWLPEYVGTHEIYFLGNDHIAEFEKVTDFEVVKEKSLEIKKIKDEKKALSDCIQPNHVGVKTMKI